MLHYNRRIAVLNYRQAYDLQILVLEGRFLISFFRLQPKRRSFYRRLVPYVKIKNKPNYLLIPLALTICASHLSTKYNSLCSLTPRYRPVVKCLIRIG